ncbi:MAG: hypothetical protein PUB95_06315, partial [Methanobrevibacter ruminantium]|uniref:hypothetical protein n=1 Tax=Methanobrevibacter ruminantium TaxID=83816 RepID=UPI0026ECB9B5
WTVPEDFHAGNYSVDLTYNGNDDYNPSVNTSNAEVHFAILSLDLVSDSYYDVKTGDIVTSTFKLSNNGTYVAKDVYATFSIPKGLSFVSASVDSGSYYWDSKSRILTWYIPEVGFDDLFIKITVKAETEGTFVIVPNLISDDPCYVNGNVTINSVSVNNTNHTIHNKTVQPVNGIAMQNTGNPLALIIASLFVLIIGICKRKI